MTPSEQFAINEWLFQYPKNASFDDILYMVLDEEDESITPYSHGQSMSRQDLANCISGTETHFASFTNQFRK